MLLNAEEITRYQTQIQLAQVGEAGQCKLKNARVLCVGAGGLGSPLLFYLAAAGVGTLGIIDDDVIELSNLQRQILYDEAHVGQQKVDVAKKKLLAFNSAINVQTYPTRLTAQNVQDIIASYDIIADCSDNFATRYILNAACYHANKPFMYASIYQFEGQFALFLGQKTPCFQCLFPIELTQQVLPDCRAGGVLGVLPGLLGVLQAQEIIYCILEMNQERAGKLLTVNSLSLAMKQFQITQDPLCEVCSLKQPLTLLTPISHCVTNNYSISANELLQQLKEKNNFLLIDVRTRIEHEQNNLGGMCIPLPELQTQLAKLNKEASIIVYCQSGMRSQQALAILQHAQFKSVKQLQGGMDAAMKIKNG